MKAQSFKFTGKKTQDGAVLRDMARLLNRGLIGVMPTDTLYGIVARADNRAAVAKLYRLRQRKSSRPFIILISSIRDLAGFGVQLDDYTTKALARFWPGKVSVVLRCGDPELKYLHRGGETLAFRLPDSRHLRMLIKQTGPLVAPSANLEGYSPSATIIEAREYFGDKISFYADAGEKDSPPSTLIKIQNKHIFVLRKGATTVK